MAIILSFIRWAKEWWYNHFFVFVFFFSKFIVQNRDDLTFFTVQTVNAVTSCQHVKHCNKIDCTDCIWLILNSRWSILYCAGKFDVFFAKNGQKSSQNGNKRQYFVHHWKAQGFDNKPYGNHYKLWLSRQYTNPVYIQKMDSRYNLNYYYRREGGNFLKPTHNWNANMRQELGVFFLPKIAKK